MLMRTQAFVALLFALIGALALIAGAPRAAAQDDRPAPSVPPRIEPGMQWRYEFGLDVSTSRQWLTSEDKPEGPAEDERMIQNATVTLAAQSADAESGVVTVLATFERLSAVWRDGEGQVEAVWTRKDAAAGGKPANPLGEILAALGGSTLTLKVTREGEVRGVEGLEAATRALRAQPRFGRDALGLFAAASVSETFERAWRTPLPAGAPTGAGHTWTTQRLVRIAPAISGSLRSEWRIDANADERVTMAATSRIEFELEEGAPDAPPVRNLPKIEKSEGAGACVWDSREGCAESARATHAWVGTLRIADQAMRETARTETSIARSEPPPRTPGKQ